MKILRIAFFCLCLFFLGLSFEAKAFDFKGGIEENESGIEFLKKKNYPEAREHFIRGLGESPESAELQFNLGLAFDGLGEKENARKAYGQILKNPMVSKELKFAAHFNLAELAGRERKIDEALNDYQRALDENPDSKEVKTNIELLIKKQQQQQNSQSPNPKKNEGQAGSKSKDGNQGKEGGHQKNQGQGGEQEDKDLQPSDKKKSYGASKPKPFESEQLSPGDVKKIMEELDRQEQKVRAEYNKKQIKENPRDKDW